MGGSEVGMPDFWGGGGARQPCAPSRAQVWLPGLTVEARSRRGRMPTGPPAFGALWSRTSGPAGEQWGHRGRPAPSRITISWAPPPLAERDGGGAERGAARLLPGRADLPREAALRGHLDAGRRRPDRDPRPVEPPALR